MDWENYLNYIQKKKEARRCLICLGELTGEIKNLTNEGINLKDEIMKTMAANEKELGKQVGSRMNNAYIPDNNRNNQMRRRLTEVTLKFIESINGRQGAEMIV